MTSLFKSRDFTSHSGLRLGWKIDCDSLTSEDWTALATAVGPRLQFSRAHGVPRGGMAFAEALAPYATTGPVLIVDDVLTTGRSMEDARAGIEGESIGLVLFARGEWPGWVVPVFSLNLIFA